MPTSGSESRGRSRVWLPVLAVAVAVIALIGAVTYVGRTFDTRGEHQVPSILGSSASWVEVFDDNFDGSTLDLGKWQPQRSGQPVGTLPFNPDLESAWFSPDNVAVADGMLVLGVEEDPEVVAGKTYPLSTGMVESRPGFQVLPGSYVEARVQVPDCDGCWPAFWLASPDVWPPAINIFYWGNSGHEERARPLFNYIKPSGEQVGPTEFGDPNRDYRGGFHTYGLLWTEDSVLPVLDGVPYPEVQATEDVTDLGMTLILNLSIRDGFRPEPGAEMVVDWVRVWRPADLEATARGGAGRPGAADASPDSPAG